MAQAALNRVIQPDNEDNYVWCLRNYAIHCLQKAGYKEIESNKTKDKWQIFRKGEEEFAVTLVNQSLQIQFTPRVSLPLIRYTLGLAYPFRRWNMLITTSWTNKQFFCNKQNIDPYQAVQLFIKDRQFFCEEYQ